MTNPLQPKFKEGDLVRHNDPVWPWEVNNVGLVIKIRENWVNETKVLWVDKEGRKPVKDWFDERDLDLIDDYVSKEHKELK
tara:strand:+ start:67 stop:309 length:243 start_codon:yes stop_codon:yes gene_type:complete